MPAYLFYPSYLRHDLFAPQGITLEIGSMLNLYAGIGIIIDNDPYVPRTGIISKPASGVSALPLLLTLFCLCLPSPPAQADDWRFTGVERIVAVSDVHGAYDALVATLRHADVIDDSLAWSGGKTHFVITGDLLDRGPDSRRVMDLIMRLEREAPRAGGRVHQLLGNHEVMNLIGDLRYVSNEEYAAFLDLESDEEREFWYRRYRSSKPIDSDEAAVRWEFDEKAPPGYFGHRRAFRHDGVYGQWLLGKPLMVVINETLFVHGGVPDYVAEYGLAGTNTTLKADLSNYVTIRVALGDAAVISPIEMFRELPSTLSQKIRDGRIAEEFEGPTQMVVDLSESPLHGPKGPTWYRGTAACSRLVEGDALDDALAKVGAKRVVVGHTPTITRQVQQRMNGRVIEIDTGMLTANYGGSGNALIIEGGELAVVNQDGRSDLWPIAHPVRVGHESMAIDDDALARILAVGEIAEVNTGTAAWQLVQVRHNDRTVSAYFRELPREAGFVPELAAYKLDRLLGLGMVPVTVRREFSGVRGTLQFVPAQSMTERERFADQEGARARCSLQKQIHAMSVFDELIQNPTRTPSSMLYSPGDWLLMLIDHENSFGGVTDRPPYRADAELVVGDQWRAALRSLDDERLRASLGEVLGEDRLAALGNRRDALINSSVH